MEVALRTDDILIEIFSHLSVVEHPTTFSTATRTYHYWAPRDKEMARIMRNYTIESGMNSDEIATRRKALYGLAVSCKAFSEHALDQLWAAPAGGLYTVFSLLSGFTALKGSYKDGMRETIYQYGVSPFAAPC